MTNERHIFAFGNTNNPRQIKWSSRETDTTWAPATTNTAGDLTVTSGGLIQGGVKFGADVLVFTDVGLNKIYYTGAPFIYGITDAGQNCRAASMRTVVNAGNFVAWMGDNSFYLYSGQVQKYLVMSTTLFLIILIILIVRPLVVAITNYLTRYGGFSLVAFQSILINM